MRRILLAALLALAWAGTAGARTESNYSGLTTMTFQNGVAPTAGYAGITDARIKGTALDVDRNYGAGTLLKVGGATATGGEQAALIAMDLSALPDSAIIFRARLWLYQLSRVATTNAPSLTCWRVNRPFTVGTGDSTSSATGSAGVTWNYRISGTAWGSTGASAHSTLLTENSWGSAQLLAASDTVASLSVFVGNDTMDTGSSVSSDTPVSSLFKRNPKSGTAAGDQYYKQTGWISFDITNLVRQSNNGVIVTNGTQVVIKGDEDLAAKTGLIIFPSSDYVSGTSGKGGFVYRPKIIVEYFDPTTSSSSGSGRRVMGAGGAGVQ